MIIKEHLLYLSAKQRFDRDIGELQAIPAIYDPVLYECPHCHSKNIIKFGMIHDRQRYRCQKCKKTFSSSYGSIYYRGRMGCHIIKEMIDELKTSSTIYSVAIRTRVNIKTALRYRHLILEKLKNFKMPKLSGKIAIDETMQVAPNAIKGKTRKRGVSNQQSLFAIGVDDKSNTRVEYLGQGHPTITKLHDIWKDKIEPNSILFHDELPGYRSAFSDLQLKEEIGIKSIDRKRRKLLSKINAACSSFQWFLFKHRGIRIKNYPSYTFWYETMRNTHIKDIKWYSAYYFRDLLPNIPSLPTNT